MSMFEDVQRLTTLYGQLLDDQRFEEWGELFCEDATYHLSGRTFRGRAEIVREISAMEPREIGLVKHVAFTPVVDCDPGSGHEARAWTDFLALSKQAGGGWGIYVGRYYDHVVLEGGSCRFRSRVVRMAGESSPEGVPAVPSA